LKWLRHHLFLLNKSTTTLPGPASSVEEHQNVKQEDPGLTSDKGSKFLRMDFISPMFDY
jgi:hypothetical protein